MRLFGTIIGTIWLVDGITGKPASSRRALSKAAWRCCNSRSILELLRCSIAASAPEAITGDSAVEKIKPAPSLRTPSITARDPAMYPSCSPNLNQIHAGLPADRRTLHTELR